jgi:outer membrane protein, heavy metal efflux system
VVGLAAGGADRTLQDAGPAAVVLATEWINPLFEELRTNHPALKQAAAQVDALASSLEGVRTWEDPTLRLGGMVASETMRTEDGDLIYGIEQKLPLFGRPRLARETAAAALGREHLALDARFQLLRRDLVQALIRAALARRTLEVGEEDLVWLQAMIQTAEERYRTGEGALVDLLRLENERAVRTNELRTDQRMLEHDEFVLNRLLVRPEASPWPVLRLPAPAGSVPYNDELIRLALANEAQLKVMRQEVVELDAMSRLTRRERLPEVGLGFQGRHYTGNGDFRQAEVMLEFSLPWGNRRRYQSDYQRDRSRLRAVEHEVADTELELREELHMLTIEIDAARREALLYRDDVLPRSERALASAADAWSAHRGSFTDVMEARRMLLDARLNLARALTRQYDRLAELVLCCGLGELDALTMVGSGIEATGPGEPALP